MKDLLEAVDGVLRDLKFSEDPEAARAMVTKDALAALQVAYVAFKRTPPPLLVAVRAALLELEMSVEDRQAFVTTLRAGFETFLGNVPGLKAQVALQEILEDAEMEAAEPPEVLEGPVEHVPDGFEAGG